MQRRHFLLASAGLAAVSGCSRRPPSVRRKLTVNAAKRLSISSLRLAQELGYFRDAGLEVEIVPSPNPLQGTAAAVGGKLDVLFTGITTAFLNAALKGARLRIVAGREIASSVCGNMGSIYGLRRSFPNGLDDLRQLKGKRVATGPSIGFSQFALEAHLGSVGLSLDDVTPVILPSPQAVAALIGGSIDALVLNNDLDRDLAAMSSQVVHSGGLGQVHPNFQCSHIFFGQTLLDSDVDLGGRFLAAYLHGVREFARGKTPKYMEDFAKTNGMDVKRVISACRNTFTPDGEVDMNSLKLFADWAVRKKYVGGPVDVTQLVDQRFLRRSREIAI